MTCVLLPQTLSSHTHKVLQTITIKPQAGEANWCLMTDDYKRCVKVMYKCIVIDLFLWSMFWILVCCWMKAKAFLFFVLCGSFIYVTCFFPPFATFIYRNGETNQKLHLNSTLTISDVCSMWTGNSKWEWKTWMTCYICLNPYCIRQCTAMYFHYSVTNGPDMLWFLTSLTSLIIWSEMAKCC